MDKPLLLFAPGAGAPSSSGWMRHWAELLGTLGHVRQFDYDYMRAGSRRPDPLPRLIAAHRAALDEARNSHSGPIVLIGKSMGGRIGCHLSLEEKVSALICLGYPLCAMGDRSKLRDKVLRELTTPVLFVQGTRDTLCPLELLEEVRQEMSAPNELFVVDGGDHSLKVPAKREPQAEVNARILEKVAEFLGKHAPPGNAS